MREWETRHDLPRNWTDQATPLVVEAVSIPRLNGVILRT